MEKTERQRSGGSSAVNVAFVIAWGFSLLFYFMQYAAISAPSVMVPELTTAYRLTTTGVSSLLGLYYYSYSAFSIMAGASLDRWGAKYTIPIGVFCLAVGIAMFGLDNSWVAGIGRLLQGAGSALAFIGAVYLASHGFPSRYLATAVGFTQCIGMLGGFAGQFVVAPLIHGPIGWQQFWLYAGAVTLVIAVALAVVTPRKDFSERSSPLHMFGPYKTVLANPQSYLCGLCCGLLFFPTTIGDMIWGVSFLHEGWHLTYGEAVTRASMVPLGWALGAPILGYLTDYLGRRKPVLLGGIVLMLVAMAAILYLRLNSAPPYILEFLLGFGSGAATISYTIIKEVNPDEVKGSATGAMNFLVFVMSAFAAPAFGWFLHHLADGGALTLQVFEKGGTMLIAAIATAAVVAIFIKETGSATRISH